MWQVEHFFVEVRHGFANAADCELVLDA